MAPAIIVADTSVLINLLKIDRMDLLGRYPRRVLVTDHVKAEITGDYPDQQARFMADLSTGLLDECRVDNPADMTLFMRLSVSQRLGAGECWRFFRRHASPPARYGKA